MNTKLLGALVVLVVGGAALGAVVTGFGPAPGGDSGTPAPTPESTGTVYDGSGGGDGSTATADAPPFSFRIDRVEKCGQTCRDVTATLYNDQETAASNVTVYTQMYAGNSTSSDDRVWSGTEQVGSMAASSEHTSTNRVELTLGEASQIQNEDGWITVVTTVETAETTITFKNRRQVA